MKGAPFILFITILQLILTNAILRVVTKDKSALQQPTTWLYSIWIVGLVLLSLPIYQYEEEFTAWSGTYMCLSLFAFSIGAIISSFVNRRSGQFSRHFYYPDNTERLIFWILFLGVGGVALRMVNSYLTGGISLSDRMDPDNALLVRSLHMEGEESRIGPLYGPAAFTYSLGAIGLLMYQIMRGAQAVTNWKPNPQTRIAHAAFVILSIAYSLLFSGGRMTIVFVGLLTFIGFASGKWATEQKLFEKKLSFSKLIFILFGATVISGFLWVSSTTFLEKRTGDLAPESLLFKTHRARFAPEIQGLTSTSKTAGYAIFTLSYAATAIPTLVFYSDLPSNRVPGPLWGQYSFPAPTRYALRAIGQYDPDDWAIARHEVFAPLADINFGSNVWATLLRDLLIDFGFGGTIIFMLGIGYVCQSLHLRERGSSTLASLTLLGTFRLLLIFSGLTSLLYMPQFHWPLYFAIIYLYVSDRKNAKEAKKISRANSLASATAARQNTFNAPQNENR